MSRESIIQEIFAERDHQIAKWGNTADDTKNRPNDWAAYIAHHSTRWFDGTFAPYRSPTVVAFRKEMIKVATLAMAAIESLDRQTENNGAPFYLKE